MVVQLRLYVAGDAPNSVAARRVLQRVLEQVSPAGVELEVVDVMAEPARAAQDGILATPTLVRLAPEPARVIVGNLGDGARVLALLDLVKAT